MTVRFHSRDCLHLSSAIARKKWCGAFRLCPPVGNIMAGLTGVIDFLGTGSLVLCSHRAVVTLRGCDSATSYARQPPVTYIEKYVNGELVTHMAYLGEIDSQALSDSEESPPGGQEILQCSLDDSTERSTELTPRSDSGWQI